MKIKTIKKRVKVKVERSKIKIAAKCKKGAKAIVAFVELAMVMCCGCMATQTPSRSQSLKFDDCTFNIYGNGTMTNEVARVEIATQAMSIENSGTEAHTSNPVQTTDARPTIDTTLGPDIDVQFKREVVPEPTPQKPKSAETDAKQGETAAVGTGEVGQSPPKPDDKNK